MVNVEAELARLKSRRNKKKYLKMFWVWSGSVAAILVGAFFLFNYLFNIPAAPPKSVTVFAADPHEQRIVLKLNDGKQFFWTMNLKGEQAGRKTADSRLYQPGDRFRSGS